MKIQKSAEDYLESILILQNRNGSVRAIDIVNELKFSKPSVSVAMRNLREAGYVESDAAGHLSLTASGRQIAEMIYERHRVLADALQRLGVSKEIALEDACRIEHVISKESFDRIKQYLEQLP